jgi:hypothetical protein
MGKDVIGKLPLMSCDPLILTWFPTITPFKVCDPLVVTVPLGAYTTKLAPPVAKDSEPLRVIAEPELLVE